MNALEVRAACTLALVYVLRMLGLFMVMPVLAVAATQFPDYSPMMVGIAIGGYGLTQAALQIPMGMMSDRWGRKPVILLGLTVFALGSIVAAMADTMAWMIAGRVLQGAGAIAGAIMALATDVAREQQRAKVMAIIGIAIGFSFYIAVLIGPIIADSWGIAGIFWVTGVLALACLPLVKWAVPNSPQRVSAETLPRGDQVWAMFTSSQLWRLNVSVMLLHMMITLLFVQIPLSLVSLGMALDSHWSLYLPVLLVSVVLLAGMMRSSRGKAPKRMLMSAIVMLLIAFAMLGSGVLNWWVVVIAMVVFFTGFNYLEANLPALVSSIAPAGQKGTAMGIYASFQFFGAFLGGVVSGSLATAYGAQGAYISGIIVAVLWGSILMGLRTTDKFKRVTLSLDKAILPTTSQLHSLEEQAGIKECVLDSQQGLLFLKVDSDFKELEARALIKQWG
ncbi:MFS transporter [Alteromonas sp. I4]|nr:MFS transporter [Alteromonas sp. I4]